MSRDVWPLLNGDAGLHFSRRPQSVVRCDTIRTRRRPLFQISRQKRTGCYRPGLAVHVLSTDYAGETSLVGCKADDVEVLNSPS